jgi:glutamyl/glutaminyl-tRNA synthetase
MTDPAVSVGPLDFRRRCELLNNGQNMWRRLKDVNHLIRFKTSASTHNSEDNWPKRIEKSQRVGSAINGTILRRLINLAFDFASVHF